jgi:hypothetical protein
VKGLRLPCTELAGWQACLLATAEIPRRKTRFLSCMHGFINSRASVWRPIDFHVKDMLFMLVIVSECFDPSTCYDLMRIRILTGYSWSSSSLAPLTLRPHTTRIYSDASMQAGLCRLTCLDARAQAFLYF